MIKRITNREERVSVGDIGKSGTICGETGLTKKQARKAIQRVEKIPGIGKAVMETTSRGVQPMGYWWQGVKEEKGT